MTGLATHVWFLTLCNNPAFMSSSTSLQAVVLRSGPKLRLFCLIGIPVMSEWVYAKTSALDFKRFLSFSLKFFGSYFSMITVCSGFLLLLCWTHALRTRLCGELDLTITKLRISVLQKGASPIVISKGTSPMGQECSPENPISGTFESTLDALMEGFSFRKQ
ncbi:hypothetical protein Tco_1217544 [Tanacetum coccineum]